MIPLMNHDSGEGEQWGRYNVIYIYNPWASMLKFTSYADGLWHAWHLAQAADGAAHRGHGQQAELHIHIAWLVLGEKHGDLPVNMGI